MDGPFAEHRGVAQVEHAIIRSIGEGTQLHSRRFPGPFRMVGGWGACLGKGGGQLSRSPRLGTPHVRRGALSVYLPLRVLSCVLHEASDIDAKGS